MQIKEIHKKFSPVIKKINFYTAALMLFSLSLIPMDYGQFLVPWLINFWVLTWLLEGDFKEKIRFTNLRNNKFLFAITAIFYLILLAGYFYSDNKKDAMTYIETRFTLILFPVIISTANSIYKEKFRLLLWSFIIANITASFFCVVNAFYQSISIESGTLIFDTIVQTQNPINFSQSVMIGQNRFFSIYFSMFMHPSYFALFLNFSILILIRFYNENIYNKKLLVAIMMLFFLVLFLLSSKIGIFIAIIVAVYFMYNITREKSFAYKFWFIMVLTVIIGIILFNISYRIKGIEKIFEKNSEKNYNAEAAMERVNTWKSSVFIISENPFFGVGTGDIKEELVKEYQKRNFQLGVERKYNSHNQYLEIWAANGLPGILSFLLLLGFPLVIAYRKRNTFLVYFLSFFVINFLVESMFNRMSAVIFFAFFFNLLLFSDPKMKESDENEK